MPKTAVPRKPESLARKADETRLTSRNRSLASLLGIGDSERQLVRDIGSGLNDVLGRGTLAGLIGLPGDMRQALWDGGAWVNNKIKDVEYATGLLKPSLGSLVTGRKAGYVPYSEGNAYLGAEDIGNRMEKAGLVSPERRPVTEAVASLISPAQLASASYRAPQMARAGTTALERLMARSTMGGVNRPAAQTGAIENLWHGSPHTFDRFDLSKIGTGEGAQAYGHGAYLAESPDVAKRYADDLSKNKTFVDGVPITPDDERQRIATNIGLYGYDRTLKTAEDALANGGDPDLIGKTIDTIKSLMGSDVRLGGDGNLYQARLAWPDAREATDPLSPDHFLHYSKRIDEQPEYVQNIIKNDPMSQKVMETYPGIRIGGEYYSRLADVIEGKPFNGANQSVATDYLRDRGIPGLRYFDQGSRGAADGTHNYVVFDDRLIDIVSRNGQPVSTLGRMVAPQDEALRIAQQNAAKPVSEGGLGLRPDNTPEERAAAMGFEGGWYHGTGADIAEFNVAGNGKTSGGGAFFTNNPIVAETYVPGVGQSGNILPVYLRKGNLLDVNARGRNWADIYTNDIFHKRKNIADIFPDDVSRNDAITTDDLAQLAPTAGFDGAKIRNVRDIGPNSHVFRVKEYLRDKYGVPVADDYDPITGASYWDNVTGDQFAEARAAVEKMYGSQKSDIVALQDPSRIRSRFAAFDPMRRDSADIMAGFAPVGIGAYLYGQQDEP